MDDKGVYYKGSSIDRKFSLAGIKKLLSYEGQEKQLNNNDFKSSLNSSNEKNNQKLTDTSLLKSPINIQINITTKPGCTLSKKELKNITNSYASILGMKDNNYTIQISENGTKNEYRMIMTPIINDFDFSNYYVDHISKKIKEKYNLIDIDISFKKEEIDVKLNTNSIPFPKEKKTQNIISDYKLNLKSTPNSKILDHLEIRIYSKRGSKINSQTLQKISNLCAAEYDLKNNQFSIYTKGTSNEVFLIKPKMNIDFNNYLAISQSDIFCAKIEKTYNLQKIKILPRTSSFNNKIYEPIDLRSLILKEKIIATLKMSNNSISFHENLKSDGISLINVDTEIVFCDKKGISVNASFFDQRLSHKGLGEIISNNDTLRANLVSESTESYILELIFDILQTLFNSNIELDESDDFEKKPKKRKNRRRL